MSQDKGNFRELVAEVAGPRSWTDTRETWLDRAAERAGITYRTIRSIWHGDIKKENHYAIQLLRLAAAHRAATELAARYESIAAGLGAADPEFHRDQIAALLDVARKLRG